MEFSDEENHGDRNNVNSDNEGGYRSDEAEEEPSGQNDDGQVGKGRRIDPSTSTKKIIRNPQPKLNAERIQGPKGLQDIENYFEGFEFHGEGHEKSDLDRVMKRLEHWAHRLFPKYQYDDFLEKMEVLGSKKNVQVYLKKYRLGMIQPDDIIVDQDNENSEKEEQSMPSETPVDEFDKLIAEQIEKQRQVTNNDSVRINTSTGNLLGSASSAKPSEITDEIKARIEANRLLAMERKAARLRREEESKKQKFKESQIDSQVFDTIEDFHDEEFLVEMSHVEAKKDLGETRNKKVEQRERDNENTDENVRKEARNGIVEKDMAEINESLKRTAESEKTYLPTDVVFSEGENENQAAAKDMVKSPIRQVPEKILVEKRNETSVAEQDLENAISAIDADEDCDKRTYNENAQGPLEQEMTIDEMDEYIMNTDESTKISSTVDVPFAGEEKENHEVDVDVMEVPVYEESNLSKTNRKVYGKSNATDKTMTHEELLMEIDGAMEEIITKSTRRSS